MLYVPEAAASFPSLSREAAHRILDSAASMPLLPDVPSSVAVIQVPSGSEIAHSRPSGSCALRWLCESNPRPVGKHVVVSPAQSEEDRASLEESRSSRLVHAIIIPRIRCLLRMRGRDAFHANTRITEEQSDVPWQYLKQRSVRWLLLGYLEYFLSVLGLHLDTFSSARRDLIACSFAMEPLVSSVTAGLALAFSKFGTAKSRQRLNAKQMSECPDGRPRFARVGTRWSACAVGEQARSCSLPVAQSLQRRTAAMASKFGSLY